MAARRLPAKKNVWARGSKDDIPQTRATRPGRLKLVTIGQARLDLEKRYDKREGKSHSLRGRSQGIELGIKVNHRKTILAGIAAASVLVTLLIKLGSGPPDPEFRGQHLSELLTIVGGTELRRRGTYIEKPIRAMGTSAVPYLRRELALRDSPEWRKTVTFLNNHRLNYLGVTTSESRQVHALMACQVLGADANGALPETVDLLERSPSRVVRRNALDAITQMGPTARNPRTVAVLSNILSSSNSTYLHGPAASTLMKIGTPEEIVLPLLRRTMTNTPRAIRSWP